MMDNRDEYYWIKTDRYGWEIAILGNDVGKIFYDVMNDGGMVYAKDVIEAIRIPYPDEKTEGENVIK